MSIYGPRFLPRLVLFAVLFLLGLAVVASEPAADEESDLGVLTWRI